MKKIWQSKTLWANVLGAISYFAAQQFGVNIPPDVVATILTTINIALRLITKDGLTA